MHCTCLHVYIPMDSCTCIYTCTYMCMYLGKCVCMLCFCIYNMLSRVYNRDGGRVSYTPVYHSVVSLDRGRDLYNTYVWNFTVCSKSTTTRPVMICMDDTIKVMSPVKAYYSVVYWSRILSLPLYYILLMLLSLIFS